MHVDLAIFIFVEDIENLFQLLVVEKDINVQQSNDKLFKLNLLILVDDVGAFQDVNDGLSWSEIKKLFLDFNQLKGVTFVNIQFFKEDFQLFDLVFIQIFSNFNYELAVTLAYLYFLFPVFLPVVVNCIAVSEPASLYFLSFLFAWFIFAKLLDGL